ncbi:hypothetical protein [Coralloluteibacterium stylophorae]|uniref:Sulfotransferase family protein n=1 Tax=Coralloluteibacterium stylophorae TaxID=1776034 RepID=A0A8J7VTR6_9GAMM|nr:hypothetical protein [Coralloluteibacterium stylophorae]MBS7456658.1 hypothetical protein [Coralloluteibacterium stylophorae]
MGYHLPYSHAPAAAHALPVLGTVRNPWAYYVSWYAFQSAMPTPNPLFRLVSDEGRRDFAQTLRDLLALESSEGIRRLRAVLPERFPGRGLNLTRECVTSWQDTGVGFYSFLYRRMYAGCTNLSLLGTDDLRAGLARFLVANGIPLTELQRERLEAAPPANTSRHAHYSRYYDADLRDLVAERDADLIRTHDYRFECMNEA